MRLLSTFASYGNLYFALRKCRASVFGPCSSNSDVLTSATVPSGIWSMLYLKNNK